jgi:hypothetical protein
MSERAQDEAEDPTEAEQAPGPDPTQSDEERVAPRPDETDPTRPVEEDDVSKSD